MIQINADIKSERLPKAAVSVRVTEQSLTLFIVVCGLMCKEKLLAVDGNVSIPDDIFKLEMGISQAVLPELLIIAAENIPDDAVFRITRDKDYVCIDLL